MAEAPTAVWRRCLGAAREVWSGATGGYGYEAYCRHQALAHPERPVLTRADYERLILARRYDGISRCC